MSNCDCQENFKEPIEYRPTITDTATEKPDRLLITTITATTVVMVYGLRTMDVRQHDALLASTLLVWLFFLPVLER